MTVILGLSDEDLAEIDLEKLLKKFEEEKLMDQELKQVLAEINLKLDLIENRISALELLQERFQNYYFKSRMCADHIEEEIRKIAFNVK